MRGLSHVIGNGGQVRLEPGANPVGLYESTDGGATFTEVWNGNDAASFGVTDVALDPLDPTTVYASAFDQGLWRRSPTLTARRRSSTSVRSSPRSSRDQDVTGRCSRRRSRTRRRASTCSTAPRTAAHGHPGNFWRTDNADQSAAALLASQAAGSTVPPGAGNPFPAIYNGWQVLTAQTTASPYYATDDTCTGQCWYDEDGVHAGRHAGHRLRHRLVQLRRAAVQHEGRRLRERPLERARGDLLDDGR